MDTARPPLPPFDINSAKTKVRMAENAWNNKNPEKVALAYSSDSSWRNRNVFITGREEIVSFLTEKWQREKNYKLVKELWAFQGNRIAVRFVYEWQDDAGQWHRSYGNENWQFNDKGLMEQRHASINDTHIEESERKFLWTENERPLDHPELSEMGL